MKKQLFTIALAFLLLPLIQACGDSGAGGTTPEYTKDGALILPSSAFISVEPSAINLGDVKIGDRKDFSFKITSIRNQPFMMVYSIFLHDNNTNGLYNTSNKTVIDCGVREEGLYFTLDPNEVCIVKVSFTVAEPILASDPNSFGENGKNTIEIHNADEVSKVVSKDEIFPINYNIIR